MRAMDFMKDFFGAREENSGEDFLQRGGGDGDGAGDIEDQKEFVKKNTEQMRRREKDLMDDDFLPSILTGDRKGSGNAGGKIKVGAGRNVNSKKR